MYVCITIGCEQKYACELIRCVLLHLHVHAIDRIDVIRFHLIYAYMICGSAIDAGSCHLFCIVVSCESSFLCCSVSCCHLCFVCMLSIFGVFNMAIRFPYEYEIYWLVRIWFS